MVEIAFVLVFAGAASLLLAAIPCLQRRFLYGDVKPPSLPTNRGSHEFAETSIVLASGVRLNGWIATPKGTEPTQAFVYFHGRRESPSGVLALAHALPGYAILGFCQRGMGQSSGSPSEERWVSDGKELVAWTAQRFGLPMSKISIGGRSLGSGVAVQVAREVAPAKLVLISAYASLSDLLTRHVPYLPLRYLLVDRFDSIAHIKGVVCPTLSIVAQEDKTVPCDSTFALLAHAASSVTQLVIPLSGHHGMLRNERVQAEIAGFLTSSIVDIEGCVVPGYQRIK
jgi:pimeloyl-ACP methyl ester carboxylesterase